LIRPYLQSIRDAGYDSVKMLENVKDSDGDYAAEGVAWVLFDANQLKSATGNRGTFSRADDSVAREDRATYGTQRQAVQEYYRARDAVAAARAEMDANKGATREDRQQQIRRLTEASKAAKQAAVSLAVRRAVAKAVGAAEEAAREQLMRAHEVAKAEAAAQAQAAVEAAVEKATARAQASHEAALSAALAGPFTGVVRSTMSSPAPISKFSMPETSSPVRVPSSFSA
jgi:septal ring factor EnvC (AmiA/AmiB activator)